MDYKQSSKYAVMRSCLFLVLFLFVSFFALSFSRTPLSLADTVTSSGDVLITAIVVNNSTPPPPASSGSSGGGGGGGGLISTDTLVASSQAIFRGMAYPGSIVTLLKSGVVVAEVPASPDASFEVTLTGLTPGAYNFGVRAEDTDGRRSALQTYSVSVTAGVTTVVKSIFLPPTIGIDKTQVMHGDLVTFFGASAPNGKVTTVIHSVGEKIGTVNSDSLGHWKYTFDTLPLEDGIHQIKVRATLSSDQTPFSQSLAFRVGAGVAPSDSIRDISLVDTNGDSRVNLKDFSILAYWFRRPNPPQTADENHDGKVDLVDFSILAYYWTG